MGRPDPHIKAAVISYLRPHHASLCRHWFDDIEPLELDGGTLKLLVREPVQLKYLQRSCVAPFTEAAQEATGRLLAVQFVGEDDMPAGDENTDSESAGRPASVAEAKPMDDRSDRGHAHEEMVISPDYSFDNFVVGPGNRLAHAASVAVAEKPGKSYNPLFIHGGVGLGKTHLLHAICQHVMSKQRRTNIYYTSCEGFMTQFMEAVQAGLMSDFRHRFRNVDVLVIDDIHDLAHRDRTQEEFFHTFNTLYQAGRQIVLSSDAPPNEIPDLEERLTSRFNCGLVARVDKPSYETRMAIVQSKALLRNIELPDEVSSFVAARIDTNIRELEGAINRIQGLAQLSNANIDLELAKQAIGDESQGPGSAHPTIQDIIDAVTSYYDVKLTDLLSKRRHKSIALPRQVCMWLARKHTRFSLEEIGGYFGGRDHTTVMHAIKAVNQRQEEDQSIDHDLSRLEQQLTHHG